MSGEPSHHWDRVLYTPHPNKELHEHILRRLTELQRRDVISIWLDDEDPAAPGRWVYVITPKAWLDEWRRD